MLHSRRAFLKYMSFGMGMVLANYPLPLWGGEATDQKRYYLVGSKQKKKFAAFHIDLKENKVRQVPLNFLVHSFAAHPHDPFLAWGMEKWGGSMVVIDFKKERVLHTFQSPGVSEFYGHGVFYPEKNAFFVARTDLITGIGYLAGYDMDTFKEIESYPVTPGGLHDCHFLPDRTVLIASTGFKPGGYGKQARSGPPIENSGLVHADLKTGKVLGKKLIKDTSQIIGHFALTKDGTIFAIGVSKLDPNKGPGEIYIGSVNSPEFRRLTWTDSHEKIGEMLSISIDETHQIAAITNPGSGGVFFADAKTGEEKGYQQLGARGVGFDPVRKQFVFSDPGLFFARSNSQETTPIVLNKDLPPLNGAHGLLV